MGIRFLCQNCDKRLNVKLVQAGTKGHCPHCSGAILVPLESTVPVELRSRKPKRSKVKDRSSHDDQSIGVDELQGNLTVGQWGTGGSSAEKFRFKQESMATFESEVSSGESFMLDKPRPPDSLGKVDPIAESPKSVWYFRSHELGERGPLKGKAMQVHLDQGDVKIGCLVWQQDWEDWIPAERVFPTLVAEFKLLRKQDRVKRAYKKANIPLPEFVDLSPSVIKTKRRKKIFSISIGVGFVVILVLTYVLIRLITQ
ncbi:MAG: DNA-directed RNA polymerase subunit RPC12/RpoP [Mariniblastus sp.]|jgi:DNA-directed RNA polymerase subunit RPC12/RpoP